MLNNLIFAVLATMFASACRENGSDKTDDTAGNRLQHLMEDQEKQKQGTNMKPINSVDAAIAAINAYSGKPEDFQLAIAESLLDPAGVNMAIITDRILARSWMPYPHWPRLLPSFSCDH